MWSMVGWLFKAFGAFIIFWFILICGMVTAAVFLS